MGKKKNAKSDQPTRAEAVDIPDDSDTGEKDEKERAGTISWADNPGWVTKAVNYLIDNSSFRIKLFSDSTEDATNDGRKRIVGKESKINMYGTLAHEIFKELPEDAPPEDTEDDVVSAEVRAAYKDNPIRFAKSLQQQFARLKKSYSAHKKTLVQTGGGLKPEDQQNNLIEKIKLAFPHWDELDGFWRELPNYNPIGVSNSTGGVDHAAAAASLFRKKAESGDTSGIEDGPDIQTLSSSRAVSSALSVGGEDFDQLAEDEEDEPKVKKKSVGPVKAEREKKLKVEKSKTGEKRTFDLASLDETHRQDMADSARRQDDRLGLEVKRTELQLERERNKRRKMELDQERLRREEERDKRFFSLMEGMMSGGMGGIRGTGGYGMQASTSASPSSSAMHIWRSW
ncbi:hypothetical protein B0H14DRAFT_2740782 [Mycena olivaceomarginata]|nr:hypothetical protein B0H14DRAFT_2740782 [Mycena olivaceomarginata]